MSEVTPVSVRRSFLVIMYELNSATCPPVEKQFIKPFLLRNFRSGVFCDSIWLPVSVQNQVVLIHKSVMRVPPVRQDPPEMTYEKETKLSSVAER